MTETENTNGAVLVAAETITETPVAAKPAKKAVVIPARKVKKGKCGHKAGAPLKDIIGLSVNRRRGDFTKREIFELNGQTVSELCIDQRLKRLMKAKELFLSVNQAKSKGSGRPPKVYTFNAEQATLKKARKAKASAIPTEPVETETVIHAEVPAETPATATVETPGTIETAV